jgi:hypothetical protein
MVADVPTAAQQEWLSRTVESDRPNLSDCGRQQLGLRQYGNADAWLEWNRHEVTLLKLEARGSGGSAIPLVDLLKELADRHGLRLIGTVTAYCTDERRTADLAKVIAFYWKNGFHVGDAPYFTLRYPPPRC